MRTHRTRSSQGCLRMASTTLARAESFSSGATESSRSRNDMSAGTVGAFSRKRAFEPGVEKHDRRGRVPAGWGMRANANGGWLPRPPKMPPSRGQVGRHELLAQELGESLRRTGHEAPAQAQPVDVAGDIGPPGGMEEELHRLGRSGPGKQ